MEIMEFCKKVEKSLAVYIGNKAAISIKEIVKNNGVVLHSIMISEKERNISPNIYLNELYEAYERGETFGEVMEEVFHIYEESRTGGNMDMGFFLDYGSMKDRVVYKVISFESNRELLRQVPYIPFLDMAVTFYCRVPETELGSNATIQIYNSHLKLWRITKERLYQDARRNTPRILPPRLLSIEEMMQEIFVKDICQADGTKGKGTSGDWLEEAAGQTAESFREDKNRFGMYVLGNRDKLFGAAVILYDGVLERIAKTLGCSFFLLPSSIHEVILVLDRKGQNAEELWKMVCEINATQVDAEDVLTNSVYRFSNKSKKLEKIF